MNRDAEAETVGAGAREAPGGKGNVAEGAGDRDAGARRSEEGHAPRIKGQALPPDVPTPRLREGRTKTLNAEAFRPRFLQRIFERFISQLSQACRGVLHRSVLDGARQHFGLRRPCLLPN